MRRSPYNGFLGKMDIHHNFPEIAGRAVVAWFNFDNHKSQDITVKVGLSAVSTDGAMRNLQAETGGKSFDDILASTRTQWEKELSVITCQGDNDRKAMLYTSLYHTMINPSVYMDVDRRYWGLDGNIHVAGDFDNYTVFSLWDTYRAEHPLLSLLKPDRNTSMVRSMLACQQQSVHHILPVWGIMGNEGWCMTGYHAVSVVADAIVNGDAVPVDEAMRAMTSTAVSPLFPGLKDYISRGWSPYDRDAQAASNTLEYAYDDWAIGAAARKAGRPDIAEAFLRRSLNWRNTFDTSRGFAAPRYANVTYKKNFDPCQTYGEGFIEGNSWNFSFAVPHDVGGLIKYMGGDRPFIAKLDSLFQMDLPPVYYKDNEDITEECLIGGYVHGNEPSHHIPYLYAWTSQPWKTQRWVRLIMNRMYRNEIRGLGGNDDCGQMSAWYVFSAMGFYPVCPGSGQYVLGAPLLPYMRVSLPNGKTIEIIAPKVSDKRCYVQSVRINGRPYSKLFITRSQLSEGCRIAFVMGDKPNRKRGLSASDKPYSLTGMTM